MRLPAHINTRALVEASLSPAATMTLAPLNVGGLCKPWRLMTWAPYKKLCLGGLNDLLS